MDLTNLDDDGGESCRICRSGPEPDQPLYHPCKCTGSIRFCHQDCLVEWLQHSRKKYCELCSHSFIFHKRYRADMPTDGNLPAYLYLRRSIKRSAQLLLLLARATLVAFVWLAVLPVINVNIWRFVFWSGEGVAELALFGLVPFAGVDAPAPPRTTVAVTSIAAMSTAALNPTASARASTGVGGGGFARLLTKGRLQAFAKSLAHDCFEGQIVTCVIVVLFVAIFLLREWILQNMPQQLDRIAVQQQQQDQVQGDDEGNAVREDALAGPGGWPAEARIIPAAALAARNNAEARIEAQAREAALALRVHQLQDRLRAANAERDSLVEAQLSITEAGEGDAADGGDSDEAGEDYERLTAAELRRMRLQRFAPPTLRAEDAGMSSESAAVSSEPALAPSHKAQGIPRPGFRFDFDTEGAIDDTNASILSSEFDQDDLEPHKPLSPFPGDGDALPASDSSEEGRWPSWSSSTESLTPRRHSKFMADGNAASLSVPSWQEGSKWAAVGTDATALPVEGVAGDDGDFWNHADSTTDKGKGRALGATGSPKVTGEARDNDDDFSANEAHPQSGLARSGAGLGQEAAEEAAYGSSTASSDAATADATSGPDAFDPTISSSSDALQTPAPTAETGQRDGATTAKPGGLRREQPQLAGRNDATEASAAQLDGEAGAAAGASGFGVRPATSNDIGDDVEEVGDTADASLAALAAAVPDRQVVLAAAANGDPVAEALLNAVGDAREDGGDRDDDNEDDGDNFDDEVGFLEEIDGLMEAIGMRGPLSTLVQNLFLMVVLCGFAMLTFVMLPYVVGKVLGPGTRLLTLAAAPIKLLRCITDPVFDAIIRLGARYVWPLITAKLTKTAGPTAIAISSSPNGLLSAAWSLVRSSEGSGGGSDALKGVEQMHSDAAAAASHGSYWSFLIRLLECSPWSFDPVAAEIVLKGLKADAKTAIQTAVMRPLETLQVALQDAVDMIDARTLRSSSSDRGLCVGLGLVYWLLALGVYRQVAKRAPMPSARPQPAAVDNDEAAVAPAVLGDEERTFRLIMEQQLLIVKVAGFLFVELILFPFGCGLLLDLCLIPIFAEPTIFNWPAGIRSAPFTFGFTRWMGGTVYMFLFAQYVDMTRGILRSGVLCFIRNPNEPGFHPIKDILSKPSLTQLRKIGASAVMYAGFLVASVGASTYFLRYALHSTGVLPLRWKPMDPLSEVPLDLLAVHLALPWLGEKIDAEAVFGGALERWWKAASRMMRLSTYMIGGDFPEQRGRHVARTWTAWLLGKRASPEAIPDVVPAAAVPANAAAEGEAEVALHDSANGLETSPSDAAPARPAPALGPVTATAPTHDDVEVAFVPDGGFCRVPGDDKAITSGPLIIPVHADGTALDERGAEAIHKQDEAAATKTPRPSYVTMYMPPHFRARITVLLALLWLTHSVATMLMLAVPLVLGRACWARLSDTVGEEWTQREPHDTYSYLLGAALVGAAVWFVGGTCRLYRRSQLRATSAIRLPPAVRPLIFVAVSLARRGFRLGRAAVLGVGLGGAVPLLVGLTINQYIVVPIRFAQSTVPEVDLWQSWALGLVECKLLLWLFATLVPPTWRPLRSVVDSFYTLQVNGFRRLRVWAGYRDVVLPISMTCLLLLLAPAALADAALRLAEHRMVAGDTEATVEREQMALRMAYGAVLGGLCALQAREMVRRRMESWTDLLKDEVFLESTELKNYEAPNTAARDGGGDVKVDGAGTVEAASTTTMTTAAATVEQEGRGDARFEAEGTMPDVLFR